MRYRGIDQVKLVDVLSCVERSEKMLKAKTVEFNEKKYWLNLRVVNYKLMIVWIKDTV